MWNRGFLLGIFPSPEFTISQQDTNISTFLLNFFSNNIQRAVESNEQRECMNLATDMLIKLIESQNIYTRLIEQRLCDRNVDWKPFVVSFP